MSLSEVAELVSGVILTKRVKFQVVLDLITDWANAWQLQVSVAKCNILKLETPQ